MIEFYYDTVSYADFLLHFARQFKARVTDGVMPIPSHLGTGYFKALHLPNGISVLISDTKFREDLVLHRQSFHSDYYVLQLHEVVEAPVLYNTPKTEAYNLLKQMVLLTHTGVNTRYFIPATVRLVSYRIIFHKQHLLEFMEPRHIEEVLSRYFSQLIQSGNIEPLDVEYRAILKELISQNLVHPLAINFVQNRTMLLLEKFLLRASQQDKADVQKLRFTDNEILRLMKIEAMLVNDFSVTPPNINYLSRISAMSPTKLKTDFKRLYGMPIYEYYQKNRMQRAKMLLMEGKYSIKEIGIKVGYSNLSHFAGSFKKEFGMLPSEMLARDGALAI